MISSLQAVFLDAAEAAVNPVLQRDPVTLAALGKLSGKVIGIEVTGWPVSLYILPHNQGVQLHQQAPCEADVTLSGDVAAFIKLLSSDEKADAMFGHGISVTGNTALASEFQAILKASDPDWEGLLGNLIGDLPAHEVSRYLGWKMGFYKQTGRSLSQNTLEYLQEEIRLLPPAAEIDHYLHQVDQIRQQCDRLAARIERLKR